MKCGIYQIQSKAIPDRLYIGSASDFHKRKHRHFHDLRNQKHANIKLQRHFNKYGEDDFIFTLIEECCKDELLIREQFYIDNHNPYFNILKIAGSHLGAKRTDETRNKIRIIKTGLRHSEETKQKLREIRKLQKNTVKGKHWKVSDKALENMRKARLGKKLSQETKDKISRALKGKPKSSRHKKNLSKPRSEYHIQRMREGWADRKKRLSNENAIA